MAEEIQKLQTVLEVVANVDGAGKAMAALGSQIAAGPSKQVDDLKSKFAGLDKAAGGGKLAESSKQMTDSLKTGFGVIRSLASESDAKAKNFFEKFDQAKSKFNEWKSITSDVMGAIKAVQDYAKAKQAAAAVSAGSSLLGAAKGGGKEGAAGGGTGIALDAAGALSSVGGSAGGVASAVSGIAKFVFSLKGAIVAAAIAAIYIWGNIFRGKEGIKHLEEKTNEFAKWLYSFWDDFGEEFMKKSTEALQKRIEAKQLADDAFKQGFDTTDRAGGKIRDIGEQRAQMADEVAARRRGMGDLDTKDYASLQQIFRLTAETFQVENKIEQVRERILNGAKNKAQLLMEENGLLERNRGVLEKAIEVEKNRIEIKRQQFQESMKEMELQKQTAEANLDKAKQALEVQKQRVQSAKEEFGMSTALEKKNIMDLANKLTTRGVASLTKEELEFAKSKRDIFSGTLATQGAALADQAGFQELARKLGLTTSAQEAAVRNAENIKVSITQAIEAKIQLNERVLAEELSGRLGPLLSQLELTIRRQVDSQLQLQDIQQSRQQALRNQMYKTP